MSRSLGYLVAAVLALGLLAAPPASAVEYDGQGGGQAGRCSTSQVKSGDKVLQKTYTCEGWDGVRTGARATDTRFYHVYTSVQDQDTPFHFGLRLEDTVADRKCAHVYIWTTNSSKLDQSRWNSGVCGKGNKEFIEGDLKASWMRGGQFKLAICQGKTTANCTQILKYQVKS